MSRLLPEDIIIRPVLTEKTWRAIEEESKYTFEVHPDASKPEIKQAVEALFGVKVEKVWTARVKGKPRRTRLDRRYGRTKSWKKAIVKLAPGHKIDLVG